MQTAAPQPVAIITGGSAGLGLVVAETFLAAGYAVMIAGRNPDRLKAATTRLSANAANSGVSSAVANCVADVCVAEQSQRLVATTVERFGRLDVLVNCVGSSDRGLIENLSPETLQELFKQNVTSALVCSQAALPAIKQTGGSIINVGSLASKVGARYIGGYAAAKHALAGLTQQLRLELKDEGVHVGIVCPGPIQRDDSGQRYNEQIDASLPDQASRPGAGARIKGLPPEKVARAILKCAQRRSPEAILPAYVRIVVAIGTVLPRLGDWLLLKFTSSKSSD